MKLRDYLRKAKDIVFESVSGISNDNVQDAVKTAYDKGNQALTVANSKITQAQGDARYLGINAKAKDADLLDGKDSTAYVFTVNISSAVDSASTTTVGSSKAVKTAYDKGNEALGVANSKITQAQGDARYLGKTAKAVDSDKLDGRDSTTFVYTSNISSATNSTSSTTVSNSLATKNTYDRANAAHTLIASKDSEYNGKFEKLASRNKINGYAGLDSAGLLSPNQIPGQTIVNVYTYASITERNAFTKHGKGDMAIIESSGKASLYILKIDPKGAVTTDSDWLALQTNVTVDVHSWNKRNGNVMPALGDYSTALILHNEEKLDGYLTALEASVPTTPGDLDAYSKAESDGRFINKSAISDSVSSTSTTNVSNSKATKAAFDKGVEGLNVANTKITQAQGDARYLNKTAKAVDSDKLDGKDSTEFILTTSISTATNSTSTTLVSAASATKITYDRATTALNTANGKLSQADADELYLAIDGKATDANLLDGKDSTYFLSTTGKAADADKLDGQHGSFYQNASNLNAGTVPNARLPATALRNDSQIKDIAGQLAEGTQTRITVDYDTANKVYNFSASVQSDNNFNNSYKSKLDNLANNQWSVINNHKTVKTGDRIILDMTSVGTIIVTLPATPKAGDAVMVADGTGLAGQGKTITIDRNEQKIMSLAEDLNFDIPGYLTTLVFLNPVRGWVVLN